MGSLEDDLDSSVAKQRRQLIAMREIANSELETELYNATRMFGSFNSTHEGYAVIKEELDELWEEVRKKKPDNRKLRKEAIQVAAMAIRFVHDLTEDA